MVRGRSPLVLLALALALASCRAPQAPAGATPTPAVLGAATGSPTAPGEQATAPPSATEEQETTVTPTPGPAGAAAPALALALELPWKPLYAGDPLRLAVRLSSPRAHEALYAQYVALKAGQPTPAPDFAVPPIPADWPQGVTLALYRLEPGGGRTPIVAPGDWAAYRLQPEESIHPALALNLVWSQEWLVPAETMQLQEGEYVITASWNGQGVDSALLGPEGTVQAEELRLAVKAPAGDTETAIQSGRLAYAAYMQGDYAGARARGQQALDVGFDDGSPERVDLYFLVAEACLGLEDYETAIAIYQRLIALQPEGSEIALLAQEWIDVIREVQAGPLVGSTPAAAGSGFAGTWDASGWGAMTLAVDGNRVTGTFEFNDGKIEGALSADGRTLEGTWSCGPTYAPPYDAGRLLLVLSGDGNSLKCRWWFGNDGESVEWLCTRAGR